MAYVTVGDLQVDEQLRTFIDNEALPGTGVEPDAFWHSLASLFERYGPRNRELLETRDRLQTEIDTWEKEHRGKRDQKAYEAFLTEIGYLVPSPTRSRSRRATRTPRSRASPARNWSCRS